MGRIFRLALVALALVAGAVAARADAPAMGAAGSGVSASGASGGASGTEAAAPARFLPGHSAIFDAGPGKDGIGLRLNISRPVPWQVRTLADPPRLVLDVREVDWTGAGKALSSASHVVRLRAGVLRPGWSRMVVQLDGPYAIASAEMRTDPVGAAAGGAGAQIRIALRPEGMAAFRAQSSAPDARAWTLPKPAVPPGLSKHRQRGTGPLIVVLDPGHGGIDPGAVHGKVHEANITLEFARQLKTALLAAGGIDVVMTRDADVFVPLETRISIARAAGADLFLSIHADSVPEGHATGATVYTLSEKATDRASELLAERHDRDDLLAGVDLSGQGDQIANVLMDMARTETMPRSEMFAADLVKAIQSDDLRMHRHPHQEADFSVLKSPDFPSALLELGFVSSRSDRKRLQDPAWRAKMVEAVVAAIRAWRVQDAAEAALLRH